MAELVVSTFDVEKLSDAARKLMRTAVRRARAHQDVRRHIVGIDEFCRESSLQWTTSEQFREWMREARKSLVVVEVIDTDFPERDNLPSSSWQVFRELRSNATEVIFEIDSQTFSVFSEKIL